MGNFRFNGEEHGLSGEKIHAKLLAYFNRNAKPGETVSFDKPTITNNTRFCFSYGWDLTIGTESVESVPDDNFEEELARRNAKSLTATEKDPNAKDLKTLVEGEKPKPKPGLQTAEEDQAARTENRPGLFAKSKKILHRMPWVKFKEEIVQPLLKEHFGQDVLIPDPYLKGKMETPLSRQSFNAGFHNDGWLRIVWTEED